MRTVAIKVIMLTMVMLTFVMLGVIAPIHTNLCYHAVNEQERNSYKHNLEQDHNGTAHSLIMI